MPIITKVLYFNSIGITYVAEFQLSLCNFQMLSLYRDPNGEGVFTETNAAMTTYASQQNICESVEMEALKKKIKELEDIIKKVII